jgi:hypothetical protein
LLTLSKQILKLKNTTPGYESTLTKKWSSKIKRAAELRRPLNRVQTQMWIQTEGWTVEGIGEP